MRKESHLQAVNLSKEFKQAGGLLPVLDDITVMFKQPSSYAIVGLSGTGKSTFLQLLSGLDTPSSGQVLFNHQSLSSFSDGAYQTWLNQRIGLVFQFPYLIRELTVLENVLVPRQIAGTRDMASIEHARLLLKQVGLGQTCDEQPAALSGGQQQRVVLARALCNCPDFLLADEPTGNLDRRTGQEIIDLLIALQKQWGMGLIVSTHDPRLAQALEHRYELKDGRLEKI